MENKNVKRLGLSDADWASDKFRSLIDAEIVDSLNCAMSNIARQVRVHAGCSGRIGVLLKPMDEETKSDEFISVSFDPGNIVIEFNVLDAIKKDIDFTLEDENPEHYDIYRDELETLISGLQEQLKRLA